MVLPAGLALSQFPEMGARALASGNNFTDWAKQQAQFPSLQSGTIKNVSALNDYLSPETIDQGNAFTTIGGQQGLDYGNAFTTIGQQNPYAPQQGALGQAGGSVTNVGGNWAALDAHNNEIAQAAQKFGVPANLLKSMINRESSGNWERDNRVYEGFRNDQILPFVGIFRKTAEAWGLNFDQMVGNKQAQIDGMAKILQGLAQQYGGYDKAAYVYFGGPAALNGGFKDELGMDSSTYGGKAVSDWHWLDQQAGYSGGVGGYGDGGTGSSIVSKALEFVGVPYVWGSLPTPGQDPWQTGWDCSAFVNWLDDTYGANELPAGSHFQYQDTINKGLLVQDPNQLRAGDLVFFDTGNYAGGGANLNRAGHVGMYIGNGQFVQAANPGAGTIVSNLSDYMGMYTFLGGRRMSWSGGAGSQGAGYGTASGQQPFSNRIQKYLFAA